MGALTAEVRAPPALRLSPGVGTLARVLRKGGTWAGGAAAQVLGAGGHVHLGIHQPVALSKGWAQQGVATDALLVRQRLEALSSVRYQWGPQPCSLSPGQEAPFP